MLLATAYGGPAHECAGLDRRCHVCHINRQPSTDPKSSRVTNCAPFAETIVEDHVRQIMIGAARGGRMLVRAVYSEDIEATARVEVVADVTVTGRADARLEKVVTRLGVEPGVTAISWRIVPTDEDEQAMIQDA
jgi:putative Mg2+ transporter-C (MgtC) family protein